MADPKEKLKTGKPPLLSWTALEFLMLKCRFDISKAREELGFNPSIPLSAGMHRVKLCWKKLYDGACVNYLDLGVFGGAGFL